MSIIKAIKINPNLQLNCNILTWTCHEFFIEDVELISDLDGDFSDSIEANLDCRYPCAEYACDISEHKNNTNLNTLIVDNNSLYDGKGAFKIGEYPQVFFGTALIIGTTLKGEFIDVETKDNFKIEIIILGQKEVEKQRMEMIKLIET